jgi:hypothetical protein
LRIRETFGLSGADLAQFFFMKRSNCEISPPLCEDRRRALPTVDIAAGRIGRRALDQIGVVAFDLHPARSN